MTWELRFSRSAQSYLARLDARAALRVSQRLDRIAADPRDPSISKPLRHPERARSSRLGDLRIIYYPIDERLLVLIEPIGPRGEVYRGL